jgi:hypothetical protein
MELFEPGRIVGLRLEKGVKNPAVGLRVYARQNDHE